MQRETLGRTFLVATTLCVVCSVLVSATAVGLRPLQEANRRREKQRNVLAVAGIPDEKGLDPAGQPVYKQKVEDLFKKFVRVELIELKTGLPASESDVDLENYDQVAAARDPKLSTSMLPEGNAEPTPAQAAARAAGIRRRENYAYVYRIVDGDGKLLKYVLPVYGKGLWSTMYGFLALDADLRTIRGLTFYKQGETPGLGGEVENPRWKALWDGKLAFDKEGNIRIHVIKGTVDPASENAKYEVDGLAGATFTSRGVTNLLQFWLGPGGFGPFLERQAPAKGGA
jgi:Na+-transporting NADH:ubiquinone oxidoreductase subunit C